MTTPNPNAADMIAAYERGDTIVTIAKRYRVGAATVAHHLRDVGKQIRHKRKQERAERIMAMQAQGMTYAQIGAVLGYAKYSVSDMMTRYRRAMR